MSLSAEVPTIDAVIVTRNRPDMLRKTIQSILDSSVAVHRIFISDDSTEPETRQMIAANFPGFVYLQGPQRGISANRNRGTRETAADYVLLTDDDMLVDPLFVETALDKARQTGADLVFSGILDDDVLILPNSLGFLGFCDRPYRPGQPYETANGQCMLMSRSLYSGMHFDEHISSYGYEEMDFTYRVKAAGFRIECVPERVNVHLNPNTHFAFRSVQDAGRLYVTFKRAWFIDRAPLRGALFLAVAIPHHVLACCKREGLKGLKTATSNVKLAYSMLTAYRRDQSKAGDMQAAALKAKR